MPHIFVRVLFIGEIIDLKNFKLYQKAILNTKLNVSELKS